jgi:hypothetical protein
LAKPGITKVTAGGHPCLARLWHAHSFKVLLALDPALYAVDADLDPYVSVYAERDRVGILIPGDWRAGFQVLDLALRLHDDVFGCEAIIGFGKETHKHGLIIAVCFDRDQIRQLGHVGAARIISTELRPSLGSVPWSRENK